MAEGNDTIKSDGFSVKLHSSETKNKNEGLTSVPLSTQMLLLDEKQDSSNSMTHTSSEEISVALDGVSAAWTHTKDKVVLKDITISIDKVCF